VGTNLFLFGSMNPTGNIDSIEMWSHQRREWINVFKDRDTIPLVISNPELVFIYVPDSEAIFLFCAPKGGRNMVTVKFDVRNHVVKVINQACPETFTTKFILNPLYSRDITTYIHELIL